MKVHKYLFVMLIVINLLVIANFFIGCLKREYLLKECERRFEMYKYQVEQGCFVDGGWNCE